MTDAVFPYGRMPYTVWSVEFGGLWDDNLPDLEDHAEFFKILTGHLNKNGWRPEQKWICGGKERNDFTGTLNLSVEELGKLVDADDAHDAIFAYFGREKEIFQLWYGTDSGEIQIALASYHPNFKQGLEDITVVCDRDKLKLMEIVNELFSQCTCLKGKKAEEQCNIFSEAADWYEIKDLS